MIRISGKSADGCPAESIHGEPATVAANASSPDGRPLTYSWNASGGKVNGTGANVQIDTAGAPAGPITINGTVSDDRGLTASCSSQVNVEVPPPPPTASKLNEINFPDKKKSARVDNAATPAPASALLSRRQVNARCSAREFR